MSNYLELILGGCFIFALGGLVGSLTTEASRDLHWQQLLVDRGDAMYCPLDGQWAFKGLCELPPPERKPCPLGICEP